ncbi:type IV pili methyl-accepting chemotaxis transducer N-terminal domain-containing protein [Arcicella sp. LKC2W]|uniref:type IV pili methyl-accepting chemotaxis transducer N-terminal domain-containing protein n=1 Tax=Arcicella sp. LKC2W TaxID=2984198 RepID=UPI002B21B5E2|nr:type IV pili methyl-accepting chemotaxis transducer N-terminal domain-containing protein [Arcicella sp. LKC2W]MEA5460604.1 type IV pili methyl-accepting chemotaxis transducer N-terminal domain-containing protein [Arcicella sp. LKC2W]
MKTTFLVAATIWVFTLVKINAQTTTPPTSTITVGASVNISGKQRMLTQRMAKAYMYIGMNINTEAANRERNNSIILFEENLKSLMTFTPTDKINLLLLKEETLWKEYKKLITSEVSKDNAKQILETNTTILNACDDVVKAYVEYAGSLKKEVDGVSSAIIADNINTSGRQRMLSQRITFYYAAYVWGVAESATALRLKNLAEFLQQNFSQLITSEVNNTEIDDAIAGVVGDWREIEEKCVKDNCYTFENKGVEVGKMYSFSSTVLSKMDKITAMYAKLLE